MVKIELATITEKAKEALLKCLKSIPFLTIKNLMREKTIGRDLIDMVVEVELPKGNYDLIVEYKTNGQPRMAREAVHKLLHSLQNDSKSYGVFMAPYISEAAAEICINEGIGYLDLSGNCHLAFDQVFIERKGIPNQFAEKRDLRSLFSDKATRVLRVLLTHPKKIWKTQALATEAKVSLGQVANVKRLLEDRELIGKKEGIKLNNPENLLNEWAQNFNHRRDEIRYFYSMRDLDEMRGMFQEAYGRRYQKYALSGFTGASFYYPFTIHNVEMAYVTDMVLTPAALGLKEVESGANYTLINPVDEGVFYGLKVIDGIPVANPIQVYLDLIGNKGRGKEAAGALLEEVIRPTWQ